MKRIIAIIITLAICICYMFPIYANKKDTTPPIVKSLNPLNNKIDVAINAIITVSFNEYIFKSKTFRSILLTDSAGFEVNYKVKIVKNVLSVKCIGNLEENEKYRLKIPISSIADKSGNAIKKAYVLVFRTVKTPTSTATPTPNITPSPSSIPGSLQLEVEEVIKAPFDYSILSDLEVQINFKGKINDISNNLLENVQVNMINLDEYTYYSLYALTNHDGFYQIPNVKPGNYRIAFSKEGYIAEFRDIVVTSNNQNMDFTLQPSNNAEPKWVTKETTRMIYHFKEGQELPEMAVKDQEDRLEFIEKMLNTKVTQKINLYYGLPKELADISGYSGNVDGLFYGGTNSIYTIGYGYNWHESSHAVVYAFNRRANTSLNEGLAVFFGGGKVGSPIQWRSPINNMVQQLDSQNKLWNLYDILGDFTNRGDEYSMCGSFVTFLLKNYPLNNFLELLKTLPSSPCSKSEIDDAISRTYSTTTLDLNKKWLDYCGCSYTSINTEGRVSLMVGGTFEVPGMSTEDIKDKQYWFRFVGYSDKEMLNYKCAGVYDCTELPQKWATTFFLQGHLYFLVWFDKNKNLIRDAGEPWGTYEATLENGKSIDDFNVILKN